MRYNLYCCFNFIVLQLPTVSYTYSDC